VDTIKRARKDIDMLEQQFEMVSESKKRLKTMYNLRGNSSSALKWKGKQALDTVWDAMAHYTGTSFECVLHKHAQ
jgi:hypothetical protein